MSSSHTPRHRYQLFMIVLGVNVHYLEYRIHASIGSYLPPLWNQAFIKNSGQRDQMVLVTVVTVLVSC